MMTKKDLLKPGLLEQYVLGDLEHSQMQAVEALVNKHDDLKAMLHEIESTFEQLGFENAIEPPSSIKNDVLKQITLDNDTEVIPLKKSLNQKWYLAIAASIAAFCLLGSFWLYTELQSVKNDFEVVNTDFKNLKNELETTTLTLEKTIKWSKAIEDVNTQQYILKGNALSPNAKLVSYVNHKSKSVIINTKQLPKLDKDHDYQLWADVDGKMINMGVIKKCEDLLAMTYIDNAESLNVTIEPAGGNDHPTVERLISSAYLK